MLSRLVLLALWIFPMNPAVAEGTFVGRWNSTFGSLEISHTPEGWVGRSPLGEIVGSVGENGQPKPAPPHPGHDEERKEV